MLAATVAVAAGAALTEPDDGGLEGFVDADSPTGQALAELERELPRTEVAPCRSKSSPAARSCPRTPINVVAIATERGARTRRRRSDPRP